MPVIERSALVMHTPAEMFSLVNQVEDYPKFLPWCSATRVLGRSETEQIASISISMAGVQQNFTTRNSMVANDLIEMQLVEGPFSHLHGCWTFRALGDHGCKIQLKIEFQFDNAVLASSTSPVFNKICGSLVGAFCTRSDVIYG